MCLLLRSAVCVVLRDPVHLRRRRCCCSTGRGMRRTGRGRSSVIIEAPGAVHDLLGRVTPAGLWPLVYGGPKVKPLSCCEESGSFQCSEKSDGREALDNGRRLPWSLLPVRLSLRLGEERQGRTMGKLILRRSGLCHFPTTYYGGRGRSPWRRGPDMPRGG